MLESLGCMGIFGLVFRFLFFEISCSFCQPIHVYCVITYIEGVEYILGARKIANMTDRIEGIDGKA